MNIVNVIFLIKIFEELLTANVVRSTECHKILVNKKCANYLHSDINRVYA